MRVINMAQKQRRTDEELVRDLVLFLNNQERTISRGELCKTLGINTETAEKWLKIGLMFQNDCLSYDYDKAGQIGVIKIKTKVSA